MIAFQKVESRDTCASNRLHAALQTALLVKRINRALLHGCSFVGQIIDKPRAANSEGLIKYLPNITLLVAVNDFDRHRLVPTYGTPVEAGVDRRFGREIFIAHTLTRSAAHGEAWEHDFAVHVTRLWMQRKILTPQSSFVARCVLRHPIKDGVV